jgi:ATP-dependent protease ClpP protease subunit
MAKKQSKPLSRIELIKQVEKERNSAVICYITGDRNQFSTKIGDDVIPILFRHLELIGNKDNIDLLLYTRGGDMVAPIRIVKIIRSFCKKFSILIPYRAHSAGTLIALGADEIVMTKLAELTPVDPTTGHPFNPRDPADQKKLIPVSVEDITSYFLLAKDKIKIKEDKMAEIYDNLTKHSYLDPRHLHPLALGNVYRAQRMIRILSERLLSLHMDTSDKEVIEKIVNEITSDICIHNYPIYRDEAKSLGLNAIVPNDKLEKMLWNVYLKYAIDMELTKPFNPMEVLGQENVKNIKYGAAYIESLKAQDTFYYDIRINKIAAPQMPGQPPLPAVNVNVAGFAWEKVR